MCHVANFQIFDRPTNSWAFFDNFVPRTLLILLYRFSNKQDNCGSRSCITVEAWGVQMVMYSDQETAETAQTLYSGIQY